MAIKTMPISTSHPPLSPLPFSPRIGSPGCSNSLSEVRTSAGISGRFRPCQWAPPSLFSPILFLSSWRTSPTFLLGFFAENQCTGANPKLAVSRAPPAGPPHRSRKSASMPTSHSTSPHHGASRRPLHRPQERLQRHRCPFQHRTSPATMEP
jgi:hypothetical protein